MSQGLIETLPAVFGRYLLLRRISRGGMGEIFLSKVGEVQGFEKPIVIKTLLPDLSSDPSFFRLFIEEAQIAIKLAHSNIVPVYEVGMLRDQYFLAMEYVAGQDVRALITRARERGQRVAPDVALYLVREVANGLAYAHRLTDESGKSMGLVHCDISPPNVLVSYEGEVKIIDFGVAKSAMQRARDRQDVSFGKFGYMAPEQLLRGSPVDRRADIYSTGVLLYELLTGERLFNFTSDADYRHVARVVTAASYPRPSERDLKLGEQFDQLVARGLHPDPAQRYQSAEELRDAVQQQLYAMNPTISADTLAALVRSLFAEELVQERRMQGIISQTDVEPFQVELEQERTQTISYALGAALPGAAPREKGAGKPPGPLAPAPTGPSRPLPEVPSAGGTRQLSPSEREAFAAGVPATTSELLGRPRRLPLILAMVAALVLSGAVVFAVAYWPESGPAARGEDGDLAALPLVVRERADLSVEKTDLEPRAAVSTSAAAPDAALASKQAPRRAKVRRSRPRKPRKPRKVTRARAKNRPRGATAAAPSPAQVQRKFLRVRREYDAFARAYGGRFEREWQRILFANTYGKKDDQKYRELDRLLDELLRRMAQVKRRGG